MDAIKNSNVRCGNLTGSKIAHLMAMGKRDMTEAEIAARKITNPTSKARTIESWPGTAAKTYIAEKNMERRLGRSLFDVATAKPLTWGKVMEGRVFELLGMEYTLCSTDTLVHPDYTWWTGTPDAIKHDEGQTVGDIKCPLTLKSFCIMADCIPMVKVDGTWQAQKDFDGNVAMQQLRDTHDAGDDYYWQLVNNACITKSKFAELIIYMPYLSELPAIRQYAKFPPDMEANKYNWIAFSDDDEIPWIKDGGYYQNINVIRFEVPEFDKQLLQARVAQAGKMLCEFI